MTTIAPDSHSYAAIRSSLSGVSAHPPLDPTTNHSRFIPHMRGVSKVQQPDPSYTERKPSVNPFYQSKGYSSEMIIFTDTFTMQYARNKTDKFAYCDYPAVYQIKSLEVKVGQSLTETLSPLILVNNILKEYTPRNKKYIINKWLGGSAEHGHINQVYEGFTGTTFNTTNLEKNVIKKAYKWMLPVAVHLFINEESHKFALSTNSLAEFTCNFQSIKQITTRSTEISLKEIEGSLEMYVVWSIPNDVVTFFNNLPYLRSHPDQFYYINDVYSETTEKKFNGNQDYKMQIRNGATERIDIYLTDMTYANSNKFFGNSIMESAENFLGSMITNNLKNTSNLTFNLKNGLFVSNNTNVVGPWSIEGFDAAKKMFNIKYQKNNTQFYLTKVTCNSALDSFGDLYMDLGTFQLDTRPTAPQIYFLKTFNLKIDPYDRSNTSFENSEETSIVLYNAVKLIEGFFTFNPDNAGDNRHAFWGIDNITRAKYCDELLFDFSYSLPVPNVSNTANLFALRRYVLMNRMNYGWLDLDKKHKVEIESLTWEKTSGFQETFEKDYLELLSEFREEYNSLRADLSIVFSARDRIFNLNTHGYIDMSIEDYTHFILNITPFDLVFDGTIISDTYKEWTTDTNRQITWLSVQKVNRTLKYTPDSTMDQVSLNDRARLNQELKEKVLKDAELYVPHSSSVDQDYLPKAKKFRSANIYEDNISANNTSLIGKNFTSNMPGSQFRRQNDNGGFGVGFGM